ncbi:MAG: serine/threonine-protein kinase [Acidobacteriota bacterium]|nr:serine/threonine-protein kinase [Acidobacteriota bacterium]
MSANTQPGAASASPASAQQIGPYQVIARIGEGGMGEVYRARDSRLNRDVALKILPRAFATDPQRMARFEREAQLLASLNHPKIAAIYGLEESGATRALVMELVEGPTLEERIGRPAPSAPVKAASASPAQSPVVKNGSKTDQRTVSAARVHKAAIPLDEALPIAQQIAEALEYAHEHGIIHRDLKPANIKITPEDCVKVLDFGLAKAMGPEEASADPSNSPTLSAAMTQAGFIIGTAAYMAPEQAKAKPVDRRADIWAFGCVLFEMLTGQKAFDGETVSDVLAAVIMKVPDWTALPETTPPSIQKLVRRCLQKDVRQRLQAIGDARITIEETLAGDTSAALSCQVAAGKLETDGRKPFLRRALPWAVAITAIVAVGIGAFAAHWVLWPQNPEPAIRFTVSPPENGELDSAGMSISPDGRQLAFVTSAGPGKPQVLWLRRLDSVTAEPIPGTEGANLPFWSPDSRQIGFLAGGKLEEVALSGGMPETLCNAPQGAGAAWNQDGVILFSSQGSLYRVPDAGGTPARVATPDPPAGYRLPQFLPDGRHFLFVAVSMGQIALPQAARTTVKVGSLDSDKTATLLEGSSNALFAKPGYLFYEEDGNLMARAFDAGSLKFTGQAARVAENVSLAGYSWAPFSVSQSGILAYRVQAGTGQAEMAWFDRKGQKLGTVGQPGLYGDPVISPDGTKLVVVSAIPGGNTSDIWVYDLKRGTGSRLTFTAAKNASPVWSLDGTRIFYSSIRNGKNGIYQKPADGLGAAQPVFQSSKQDVNLDSLSPDGRFALYMSHTPTEDDWVVPLAGDQKAFPYLDSSFAEGQATFSPNGRYIAYFSTETGRPEIYVQTFPQHLGKWQISTAGGGEPMWRGDGKELFYVSPTGEMMSVDVATGSGEFHASPPKLLFQQRRANPGVWRNIDAVSPDGQRFLMLVPESQASSSPITVVVNWPAVLKK